MLKRISPYWSVLTRTFLAGVFLAFAVGWPHPGHSATNEATDPGGGNITLIDSGPVTVNSVTLALVKQARDLSGAVLPDGAVVTPGQQIYFVLIVDNVTVVTAEDIRISDLVNESEFTYSPNSLETALVPTGSDDAAIWAGSWTALTDSVGGPDDTVSITDSGGSPEPDRITIGAEAGQMNQVLDIPASSLRAIRFMVTVD